MNKILLPRKMWQWEFALSTQDGNVFQFFKNDTVVAEANYCGGSFTCNFLFDFSDVPCTLSAKAEIGDSITIRYWDYRIEVYVNAKLCDEDWPYGALCLDGADLRYSYVPVAIEPYNGEDREDSIVVGEFTNAEGWSPDKNVWVGDCMPFSYNGIYHVYYLKDRRHHGSKWGMGAHQWAHISSEDMVHWKIHPLAIAIDNQEEASICTGSVIHYEGRFYAFYSVRKADDSASPLCCAISAGEYRFVKSDMCVYLSEQYRQTSVRDPKVFTDSGGVFHMFVTTALRRGENWQGCLAHLSSVDLVNWKEEEPALLMEEHPEKRIEPECSDYFYKNGWFYLVAGIHGRGQYWMSKAPFGPWVQPENYRIPCGRVPKMAFWQEERLIFTGFIHPENFLTFGGKMIFKEAIQLDDGTLEFIAVKEMQ